MTTTRRTVLDAGGGAPLLPAAREAFLAAVDEGWADPLRLSAEGRRARLLLDSARASLAADLGVRTEELHLTPSHTHALHSAVLAVARARRRVGSTVVLSAVDRAALHAAATAAGHRMTVPVDRTGRIDLDAWTRAVTAPGVVIAALQHANGEVGTRQPVAAAHRAAMASAVPLLLDAGASAGHDGVGDAWDLLAANPADWGSPRGVGVLAIRARVRTVPVAPEDDDPWAPGGVSVPAAVAAAVGLRAALADRDAADAHRRGLVDQIRSAAAALPDVQVLGDDDRLPHVVTFSCLFIDGEALVTAFDRLGFAVGSGSACTSSALEPSHVLAAMGALTHGNVRIALPRGVAQDDVDRFVAALPGVIAGLRAELGAEGL